MHLETLAPDTKKVLEKMAAKSWLSSFYLAGGTALALHYGHRQSVDLDWFTEKKFRPEILLKKIVSLGTFQVTNQEENTLDGLLDGVKISFMTFPYPLVAAPTRYSKYVQLASPLDIAFMKLNAISGRNAKKDFVDLYVFCRHNDMTLKKLIGRLDEKFGNVFDYYHLYKSLVYFDEADKEPSPILLEKISWPEVKKFFQSQVKALG